MFQRVGTFSSAKKEKEKEKEVGAFREIDSFPNIVLSVYFLTLPSPSPLSLF